MCLLGVEVPLEWSCETLGSPVGRVGGGIRMGGPAEGCAGQGHDDDGVEAGEIVARGAPVEEEPLGDQQLELAAEAGLVGAGRGIGLCSGAG